MRRYSMKAVLKTRLAPGFELGEVDRPRPGLRDVVIKVKAAAICGSDLNFYVYEKGFCDSFIKKLPFIPGHECSGEVVETGAAVTHVKKGDRVAFDSHIPCGYCEQCQRGLPHTCSNMGLFGHNMDGCFAEYTMAKETGVRKIPDDMSWEQGAMLEPLGVIVRPVFHSEVGMSNIGVAGCGAIGQFAIAFASALGANSIYAMDVNPKRLELAREMGATVTIDSGQQPCFSKQIQAETGGLDAFIDASGNESAINEGLRSLHLCGKFMMVGNPKNDLTIADARSLLTLSEVELRGNWGRSMFWTWEKAERFLLSGKIDINKIITHRFPLEEFDKAFKTALSGEGCKIVFTFEN